MIKQYTEDSLQPWMDVIRELREDGLEEVTVSVADLAITQDHIEDLEYYEQKCEKLEAEIIAYKRMFNDEIFKQEEVAANYKDMPHIKGFEPEER